MKAFESISVLGSFLIAGFAAAAPSAAQRSADLTDVWKESRGAFAKAVLPGAGFSFAYDGKQWGPVFSSDEWRQTLSRDAESGAIRIALMHRSGLVVTREMRRFPAFGAVEYRLHFKNSAKQTLPALSSIKSLDISFGESALDGNCVISSGGAVGDYSVLPPQAFAIRKGCLAPTVSDYAKVQLGTEGGRSSNKDLPFFFLQNDAKQEGVYVAVGWSGQWAATIFLNPVLKALNLTAQIPDLEIALEPGEEILGPSVLVGLYQGALADGSNRLRRLIHETYTPRLSGQEFLPAATFDTWFGDVDLRFDQAQLRQLADGAAQIGQEYFLLDAGWFVMPEGKGFLPGVGNWDLIDTKKLPGGLRAVADDVRSKGLKFGLWFEPERVGSGTQLARAHPEWILWKRIEGSELTFNAENNPREQGYGLLDYGRPEVQKWAREMLDRYIREYDVKYIRYDFNLDPLPYWEANDKPGRRGMLQLKHIQGFYSVIDWLRERHPETVLEACASGGRRIDLETARRFHTFWISDYSVEPSIVQFHLFGINYFLPGNYHYIQYTLPTPFQSGFHANDLGFQSLFGGAFGIGGRVYQWPEPMKQQARRHVEVWKRLRRYLVEDYYPLSEQPGDLKSWSGWQFHDPKDQSGFVQTFRTQTPDETHRFLVHGLDERARYRFTDAYGAHAPFEASGEEAMKAGIEVSQQPMSSRVFMYKKIAR